MATLIRIALLVLVLAQLPVCTVLAGDYGHTDPAPDVPVPDGGIEPPAATLPEAAPADVAVAAADPGEAPPVAEAPATDPVTAPPDPADVVNPTDPADPTDPVSATDPAVDPASVDAAVEREAALANQRARLTLPDWEEEAVLTYILRSNPVLKTQQAVTREYRPPVAMERIYHNTQVFAQVGTGSGAAAGIRIAIPLDSPLERRQYREKVLAEMTAMDGLRTRVLEDISMVRQTEADLRASRLRLDFLEDRAAWVQDRVRTGYGVVEELWAVTEALSVERANHAKLEAILRAQRRRLASHAGDGDDELHAYLEGTGELRGVMATHTGFPHPPVE